MAKPITDVDIWYHGSKDHNSYPIVEFVKGGHLSGERCPATFFAPTEESARDYAEEFNDGYASQFGVIYAVKIKDVSNIFDFRLLSDENGDLTPFGEEMVAEYPCFENRIEGIKKGDWEAIEGCADTIKDIGYRGYVEGPRHRTPDLALFYPHEDAEIIDGYRIFVGGDDREGPQDVTLFPDYLKRNGKPTSDRKNVFEGDDDHFELATLRSWSKHRDKTEQFEDDLSEMFGIPVEDLTYHVDSSAYPDESWPTTIHTLKVWDRKRGREPSEPNAQVIDTAHRDWSNTISVEII